MFVRGAAFRKRLSLPTPEQIAQARLDAIDETDLHGDIEMDRS